MTRKPPQFEIVVIYLIIVALALATMAVQMVPPRVWQDLVGAL